MSPTPSAGSPGNRETSVILMVSTRPIPHVAEADRYKLREIGRGVFELTLYYGFRTGHVLQPVEWHAARHACVQLVVRAY